MIFLDDTKDVDERVRDLIKNLKTEEKIGFLSGKQKAVERLGIKEREIGTEYARGWSSHEASWYCTVFPQTIGMASTFDRELIHEAGKIAGLESRAYYNSVNKSLFGFGPTVDLERDPRWGRHEEGYGEDPYLTGEMASAYTAGIVGEEKVKCALPLLKHFICNNTETDRDRYNAEVPEKLLREYYFEVFRKPIENGSAFGVMSAYNKLNGNPGLLNPANQKWVKDTWGGRLVVSDGGAFSQIMTAHGVTKSHAETLALAIKRGANIMLDASEMVEEAAKQALSEGLICEEDLDKAIYDTLYLRFMLGEFDAEEKNPYRHLTREDTDTEQFRKVALKMAEEQVILLKNNGILPLSENYAGTIALIGPQADENFMDWYTGASSYDITVSDGFRDVFSGSEILCDHGRDTVLLRHLSTGKYIRLDAEGCAVADAGKEDAEPFERYDWGCGYVNFKSVRTGKMLQEDGGLIKATAKDAYMWFVRPILTPHEKAGGITFTAWNKQNVLLNEEKKLLVKEKEQTEKDVWDIEVISSGLERCRELSRRADVSVCCVGNHPVQVGREGYDRESIALAPAQERLLKMSVEENPRTVLLMVSSYPYGVDEWDEKCAAVVYTTHAGPQLGTAVARIFAGLANPSGKLPCTWYKKDFAFPSLFAYDIEKSGMTYLYLKEEPLYPFGYGLSYSRFDYANPKVQKAGTGQETVFTFSFDILNTSDRDGCEAAQIYVSKKDGKYKRPLQKLCAFTRVPVKAKEKVRVLLSADTEMLKVYDEECEEMVLEEGEYVFRIGTSSRDIRCEIKAEL